MTEGADRDLSAQSDPDPSAGREDLETAVRSIAEQLSVLSRLAEARPAADPVTPPPPPEPAQAVPAIAYLHGLDAINEAIGAALAGARREILTAQPDGPRPGPVLDKALESVRRHIEAGVSMRTLYQHTTRFDETTKQYVRAVTEFGVRVRTLAEFFDRLIIVDDAVAFISANESRTTGLAIRETAIVRFLRDTFERSWDRAKEFPFVPLHASVAAREVIPSLRDSISSLLVAGYSDKRIARRLGISERSLQGHIAALKQQLGADTRVQLGYLLGRNETEIVV
ncbi:LuxR C-terminal-related transcriptional regulator [Streptomyces fragilis]|uniref:LuxR C-terminal-related transcriptional regulator n=1 Tax=Streptomyces fragilis TaxID=67301 RepID=A0ABV2YAV4_9ACTN|nr:LuxR C-terminal-related transcriptional regulator [Streptomyces fragilis]